MQKLNKIILLSAIFLIFILCISSVSAVENARDESSLDLNDENANVLSLSECIVDENLADNKNDDVLYSDSSSKSSHIGSDKKSYPLKEPSDMESGKDVDSNNSIYYVDLDSFDSFFDESGVLRDGFNDSELKFNGEFVDKGVLYINSPNVCIIGNNTLFNNTVFCLAADNIMLKGLDFALDKDFPDNCHAGILVLGDNCTVYNCSMNYTIPDDTDGFCVYCKGNTESLIENFTLVNCNFSFIGNNFNKGWDYGIFIDYTYNAMIYGNNINASLPLRDVNWGQGIYGGVGMDAVAVIALQSSPNLMVSNNNVSSYVSGTRSGSPTLDAIIVYRCNNATFEKNSVYSEDFYTTYNKINYLYGIDIYLSDDVTILDNQLHIYTTGGTETQGTAYPIQVTGPANNIKIAYNNITSVSFGPNVGIYSENYYGDTKIDIISNFINVTGKAGAHYWALVAGIEVQDSDDLIWNNTIFVTNMGEYKANNNIYGISYSQNTGGNHTYNIQYNNVTTNGRYAVSLAGTASLVTDSIIANNILNTKNFNGDKTVRVGLGINNTIYNNSGGAVLDPNDLPDWLKNHQSLIPWILLPKYLDEDSNGSGLTDDIGNGTAPWNNSGGSGGTNNGNGNSDSPVSGNGSNPNSDSVLGSNRDTSPGVGGDSVPSISAASPSDSGSSAANPNAYEIDEHDNVVSKSSDYLQLGLICIVALLLLLVGYKRQKDKEEEE